jgi:hypothetical protein
MAIAAIADPNMAKKWPAKKVRKSSGKQKSRSLWAPL